MFVHRRGDSVLLVSLLVVFSIGVGRRGEGVGFELFFSPMPSGKEAHSAPSRRWATLALGVSRSKTGQVRPLAPPPLAPEGASIYKQRLAAHDIHKFVFVRATHQFGAAKGSFHDCALAYPAISVRCLYVFVFFSCRFQSKSDANRNDRWIRRHRS